MLHPHSTGKSMAAGKWTADPRHSDRQQARGWSPINSTITVRCAHCLIKLITTRSATWECAHSATSSEAERFPWSRIWTENSAKRKGSDKSHSTKVCYFKFLNYLGIL